MSVTVQVPSLGESITEAIIISWNKKVGDFVKVDEILVELETDKITAEVPSPVSGTITELKAQADDTVNVGDVIAVIEPGDEATAGGAEESGDKEDKKTKKKGEDDKQAKTSTDNSPAQSDEPAENAPEPEGDSKRNETLSPAVHRLVEEHGLNPSDIKGTGPSGRLLKEDVLNFIEQAKDKPKAKQADKPKADKGQDDKPKADKAPATVTSGQEERVRMTKLRQTIARRLVEAQHNAAMLTTFNEVDMTNLMALRKRHQDAFVKRHGTKLGFMSVFVKAAVEALKEFPAVNAEIDGDSIIYKNYYHVGVAVGGGKGLVVPVVRDVDQLSFAEIELEIQRLAEKAKNNALSLAELTGGTFTISNGGVYGSMLSTPILNAPQSGILGMHNIIERPIAVGGKVEIRPMMYLALTYDHRIIDGREAVSFLVRLKQCVEDPERILFEV